MIFFILVVSENKPKNCDLYDCLNSSVSNINNKNAKVDLINIMKL